MILLDTDHLSIVSNHKGVGHNALMARLKASGETPFATSIICVAEQCQGWLAQINRLHRDVQKQVPAYTRLAKLFHLLRDWEIALFDERAADQFIQLRKQKIKIGTHDLKIAAITLVHDALLLSANLRDFQQVPDLRVENWLA